MNIGPGRDGKGLERIPSSKPKELLVYKEEKKQEIRASLILSYILCCLFESF